MKPLIELATEQYKSLMHQASDALRSHLRLKNAVETQAGTIAILCDIDEAETFRQMAKQFCPDAVPQIESDQTRSVPWMKREAMTGVTLAVKLQL
jgi:hypothetical protein